MAYARPRAIDCETALARLAEYLDDELGAKPGAELERHIEACRSCYSRAEFERRLRARLRELRRKSVDPAFEQRICDLAKGFSNS